MKTVSIFDRILNGCPVQIEKFASFLGSRLPTLSSMPRVSAGVKVIALNASSSGIPLAQAIAAAVERN